MHSVTDTQFYLNSEDVRFVDMKHEEVERRQSKRSQQLPTNKLHKLDTKQLESLKKSCWDPMWFWLKSYSKLRLTMAWVPPNNPLLEIIVLA